MHRLEKEIDISPYSINMPPFSATCPQYELTIRHLAKEIDREKAVLDATSYLNNYMNVELL